MPTQVLQTDLATVLLNFIMTLLGYLWIPAVVLGVVALVFYLIFRKRAKGLGRIAGAIAITCAVIVVVFLAESLRKSIADGFERSSTSSQNENREGCEVISSALEYINAEAEVIAGKVGNNTPVFKEIEENLKAIESVGDDLSRISGTQEFNQAREALRDYIYDFAKVAWQPVSQADVDNSNSLLAKAQSELMKACPE